MTVHAITRDEVRQAAAALEARGETPSGNKVLALLGHGSKKTVLKFLRQLPASVPEAPRQLPAGPVRLATAPDDPVFHGQPVAAPAAPADAARRATWRRFCERRAQQEQRAKAAEEARLDEALRAFAADPVRVAELHLTDAREALVRAKLALLGVRDVLIDGRLHGSLHQHDPAREQAVDDVQLGKQEYDRCWAALADAMVARQQQAQQAMVLSQEAWVREHRPDVVRELARAEQTYANVQRLPDDTQKPKAHYAARFVLQQARAAYSAALSQASFASNGTTAPEGP